MNGIDLHTHSNFSDGELSPSDLLQRAAEQHIHTLAVTDHDTLDGYFALQQAAQDSAVRLISGVELSVTWLRGESKKALAIHVVALDIRDFAPINALLTQQKQQRAERARLICQKLQQLLKIELLDDIRLLVDGHDDRITRSHIAQILLQKGIISRQQQAFDRFLGSGKPAYIAFDGVSLADAIAVIHQSGGLAVLAHPTKYDLSATLTRALIADFAAVGGDAVELPPPNETPSARQMIDRVVAEQGLKVSIGSDFHGSHMPWARLGQVPVLKNGQVGIWQQFQSSILPSDTAQLALENL